MTVSQKICFFEKHNLEGKGLHYRFVLLKTNHEILRGVLCKARERGSMQYKGRSISSEPLLRGRSTSSCITSIPVRTLQHTATR